MHSKDWGKDNYYWYEKTHRDNISIKSITTTLLNLSKEGINVQSYNGTTYDRSLVVYSSVTWGLLLSTI